MKTKNIIMHNHIRFLKITLLGLIFSSCFSQSKKNITYKHLEVMDDEIREKYLKKDTGGWFKSAEEYKAYKAQHPIDEIDYSDFMGYIHLNKIMPWEFESELAMLSDNEKYKDSRLFDFCQNFPLAEDYIKNTGVDSYKNVLEILKEVYNSTASLFKKFKTDLDKAKANDVDEKYKDEGKLFNLEDLIHRSWGSRETSRDLNFLKQVAAGKHKNKDTLWLSELFKNSKHVIIVGPGQNIMGKEIKEINKDSKITLIEKYYFDESFTSKDEDFKESVNIEAINKFYEKGADKVCFGDACSPKSWKPITEKADLIIDSYAACEYLHAPLPLNETELTQEKIYKAEMDYSYFKNVKEHLEPGGTFIIVGTPNNSRLDLIIDKYFVFNYDVKKIVTKFSSKLDTRGISIKMIIIKKPIIVEPEKEYNNKEFDGGVNCKDIEEKLKDKNFDLKLNEFFNNLKRRIGIKIVRGIKNFCLEEKILTWERMRDDIDSGAISAIFEKKYNTMEEKEEADKVKSAIIEVRKQLNNLDSADNSKKNIKSSPEPKFRYSTTNGGLNDDDANDFFTNLTGILSIETVNEIIKYCRGEEFEDWDAIKDDLDEGVDGGSIIVQYINRDKDQVFHEENIATKLLEVFDKFRTSHNSTIKEKEADKVKSAIIEVPKQLNNFDSADNPEPKFRYSTTDAALNSDNDAIEFFTNLTTNLSIETVDAIVAFCIAEGFDWDSIKVDLEDGVDDSLIVQHINRDEDQVFHEENIVTKLLEVFDKFQTSHKNK